MHLSSEIPFSALGHPDKFNPVVANRKLPHDVIRPIGRAVADDNPFLQEG
jgi:hypothetical protein